MSDRLSPLAYPAVRPLPYKTHRLATYLYGAAARQTDRQTRAHLPPSLSSTDWVGGRTYVPEGTCSTRTSPSTILRHRTWRAPNRSRRELYGEVPVIKGK